MRHRRQRTKLGRPGAHRDAMLANLVCSLIEYRRVKTTVTKAKAARSLAEKMVTLGKQGGLAARRRAVSVLRRKDAVALLFGEIAPAMESRNGGYTRIMRLGKRQGDNAEMAVLEWVDFTPKEKKKTESRKRKGVKQEGASPKKESSSAGKGKAADEEKGGTTEGAQTQEARPDEKKSGEGGQWWKKFLRGGKRGE